MAEDYYGWLFVDTVPLLYDEKNVARQQKVETWLDLYQLTKELEIEKTLKQISPAANPAINYII